MAVYRSGQGRAKTRVVGSLLTGGLRVMWISAYIWKGYLIVETLRFC